MIKLKDIKLTGNKREKQTRYLSQAIQLEEAVNPHIIRATMTMVSLAVFIFLVWAGLTNVNEVARTPGEVVPFGHQQTVQHLEGGIVKAIEVGEGDVVEKGQTLMVLSEAELNDDLQRAELKDLNLKLQSERLRAFIDKREPNFSSLEVDEKHLIADQKAFFEGMRDARKQEEQIIRDQLAERQQSIHALKSNMETIKTNLSIANDMLSRRRALNDKGYASDMQILQDRQRVNDLEGEIKRAQNQVLVSEKEIIEYQGRLQSLSAKHKDQAYEKLAEIQAEQAQNNELIEKLQKRLDRLYIRAPERGLIKGLSVNTIGAVISPAQTIMEIVPLDKNLEVEVKISPQDVGHLKIGQPVQIKFSSFDFSRYGSVEGYLDYISATTFTGDRGERYYQGRVLLNQTHVGRNEDNQIMPGMTVMADVITGEKTILQYMLKPIHISLKTAFTER